MLQRDDDGTFTLVAQDLSMPAELWAWLSAPFCAGRGRRAASPGISAKQAKMMRHAVGQKWHRNHYVAPKGTEEDSLWMLLETAGYAREFRDGTCMRTWHLTDAGIAALKAFEAEVTK